MPQHYWVPRVLGALTVAASILRLLNLWAARSTAAWRLFARHTRTPPTVPQPADAVALWRARRAALDQAQARYLYALLLTTIFYWALDLQFYPIGMTTPPRVTFPFVAVEISAFLVWATGPLVIPTLCLALLGTHEATRQADEGLARAKAAATIDGETFDAEPTALEMAFYSTSNAHRPWRAFSALSQPVALLVPCAFVARLLLSPLWREWEDLDPYRPLRLAGAVLLIACVPRFARLFVAAVSRARMPAAARGRARP
jgi:hypothetical protein